MARELTVFPVLNGWVVKIGCTFIAYTDKAVAEKDFSDYLTDSDKKEKEMRARYAPDRIFPEIMGGGAKMSAQVEDCGSSFSGIEKALRR